MALIAASGFSGSTPWCFLYLVLRTAQQRDSEAVSRLYCAQRNAVGQRAAQNSTVYYTLGRAPSICEPDHDAVRIRAGAVLLVHRSRLTLDELGTLLNRRICVPAPHTDVQKLLRQAQKPAVLVEALLCRTCVFFKELLHAVNCLLLEPLLAKVLALGGLAVLLPF